MLLATLSLSVFTPAIALSQLQEQPSSATHEARAIERVSPALFSWGDLDGDGRLELAAVSAEGVLQLLRDVGDGRFEDVTERAGLSGIGNAALTLWVDYEADGRLDLFVGARAGASRLFRNEGGFLVDMTEGSGLLCEGAVQSAEWLDHDGDGRPDLHVLTAERHELYRGLEGGFFERSELPLAGTALVPAGNPLVRVGMDAESPDGAVSVPLPSSAPGNNRSRREAGGLEGVAGGHTLPAPSAGGGSSSALVASCLLAIRDQANPSTCIQASSTPALGKLYPISANLFVAVGGDVGIGTTSPAARLHVAGTARITDTLTLAPSGDQALDVSTGSIYKGGALFIHTKGGMNNTALGPDALASVTSGDFNTASGASALRSNTTGRFNTASGASALRNNTTGQGNTASGNFALYSNTTAHGNTASGYGALRFNTIGFNNTASGHQALFFNTTGFSNTASGFRALFSNTTGRGNTASGVFALQANTTGFNNVASGNYALHNNTTGYDNMASGAYALRDNTTGQRNTASGTSALSSNTTGNWNTASGADALRYNTTGTYNTASGISALRSNTTGYRNTASGATALLSNTTGNRNTASGALALRDNTTGTYNTASGAYALRTNTTGILNTASGTHALLSNTTGNRNTAIGSRALNSNTTGYRNTACGYGALNSNTAGARNTACGYLALSSSTGIGNIALGFGAGQFLTTGNDNITIGNYGVAGEQTTIRLGSPGAHFRAFIAGIRGATTGVANAIPVVIDSAGQLGTISSSRRFKEEIRDMEDRTERLLQLRPVVFRYKPEVQSGERPLEYGLIAEEVGEVFPELVVYDDEGKPFTVKYHLLSSMLLNEFKRLKAAQDGEVQKLHEQLEAQRGDLEAHERELEELRSSLAAVESRTSRLPSAAIPADGR